MSTAGKKSEICKIFHCLHVRIRETKYRRKLLYISLLYICENKYYSLKTSVRSTEANARILLSDKAKCALYRI